MSEDIFGNWNCGSAKGMYRIKARYAGKHPTVHRTVYHNKELSSPNVSSAKVGNPCMVWHMKQMGEWYEYGMCVIGGGIK